jgi:hypothetical protein
MITFEKFLTEAIPLPEVVKHKMSRKNSGAYTKNAIAQVFGNKDRLVLPFDFDINRDYESIKNDPDSTFYKISELLDNYNFYIKNIKDYVNGICYKKNDKNVYKIGKILTEFGNAIEMTTKKGGTIKTTQEVEDYKADPIKNITDDSLVVVVSRHPYDIYGMSTDRSWTSCMNMGDGSMKCAMKKDVKYGSIIMYLVPESELKQNGKIALKKPLARILLRPIVNPQKELAYSRGPLYGAKIEKFKEFANDWVSKNFNSKIKNKKGFVYAKGLYDNDYSEYPNIDRSNNLEDKVIEYKAKGMEDTNKFVSFLKRASIDKSKVSVFYDSHIHNGKTIVYDAIVNYRIPINVANDKIGSNLIFFKTDKDKIKQDLKDKNSDVYKLVSTVGNIIINDNLNEIVKTKNFVILSYSVTSTDETIYNNLLNECFPIIQKLDTFCR